MSSSGRIRESVDGSLDPQYVRERQAAGWRLVGVEWERDSAAAATVNPPSAAASTSTELPATIRIALSQDAPFGQRVVPEDGHLEENPDEMRFLLAVMELIIQDISISKVAEELTGRGFRTRSGHPWGPIEVFNLLPRLIELTPRIFRSEEWVERRRRLTPVF